ncbi:54S ribosomal protein L8, mitochondrial [Coemansia sp. RSA 1813]|nr:54S ribosomal protein L8, mitochondrial [Coemansia sp. RSA 1646]KAJ1773637.1 54S ribosomal protein L8, mitochondrial [Coemansia sp. RSA 1843]KAJ2092346.1 54S ribosomal protein L8, mitochondrial [Coemansia sp. RSA 986]KAJ2217426.1 54S ribosomal protein L8, mitochondrial [Coemansia sp. RSA 487]KAJ2572653.1 54S ribosomal protein L8, mitochondrial [Coemansia sp. RSA 1813]
MHAKSKHRKLNMHSALRRQVLRNLTTDLIKHGRIETTIPRAKELRRLVDKMITLGKRGTEHDRNQIEAYLYQPKAVVPLLMDTYAKRFADRPGGFTRIINIGHRKGDHAPMAMIEILNTENPESEVAFSYLVKSLANMQLQEETKIVDKALAPAIDAKAVFTDKRAFKKALDEQKSKEKFALKITKAMKNAGMSAEKLQEIVDENVNKAQAFQEAEASKKVNRYVKELWPENTPAMR